MYEGLIASESFVLLPLQRVTLTIPSGSFVTDGLMKGPEHCVTQIARKKAELIFLK